MAKLVSKTYGDALFQVAKEEKKIELFADNVIAIEDYFNTQSELTKVMAQPKIVKSEKIKMIEEIFAGKIEKEIIGLLNLLIEKGHSAEVGSVFAYFMNCVKEEQGIGVAEVTTAVELREEQKQDIEKKLLETTDYTSFEMHYAVDEKIIGGMIIRIGDRVVDSSIKTKIYGLSKELRNIQLA